MTMAPMNRPSPLGIPAQDLQRCHDLLGPATWSSLAGQRIFMTGGTGFVGKWLLATLLDADERWGLGCCITVLSRDPAAFMRDWPIMADRVRWVAGDVRDFPIGTEHHDVVIHAATDVIAQATPQEVFSTCLDGTRRVLALAHACGARRLLLLSSGAIYGPLPAGMTHVPETYLGGPDPLLPGSAYGEGKRVSEWLVAQAATDTLSVGIARLFAVVGPHLPLDKHFAVGNFLRAAMDGKEIVIKGDGTPHRSYLYAADMAAWLWAVLLRGRCGHAYNVGSEDSVSILELARRVAQALDADVAVHAAQTAPADHIPQHYVPRARRAREDLGLPPPLGLDDALRRTACWHGHTAISGNSES
ncbi:MAG: UDP-glucuronate decarboxylase [Pseudomonadota bacterium]|nr:UDP-glucuronate decarboxylase [Pseudomonadota bacterium]